jgi:hypothetical protein
MIDGDHPTVERLEYRHETAGVSVLLNLGDTTGKWNA